MALNRDAIIGVADIPVRTINVPTWGDYVHVKRPSIRERDVLGALTRQFLELKNDGRGKTKNEFIKGEEAEKAFAEFRLKTVGFALCDESGKRLFSDDEIDPILGSKSSESIELIFNEMGNVFKDAEE